MIKFKKYILKSIREFTNLHTEDIDENNINISDLQYEQNCNKIKTVAKIINYQIYKGTSQRLVCDIDLCCNGELSIQIYDNNKYKEVYQTYLKF